MTQATEVAEKVSDKALGTALGADGPVQAISPRVGNVVLEIVYGILKLLLKLCGGGLYDLLVIFMVVSILEPPAYALKLDAHDDTTNVNAKMLKSGMVSGGLYILFDQVFQHPNKAET